MIDIDQEQLIPIREVPKRLPLRRSGRPVHISAIYRWITRGVGGVRLEAVKIGGTTYTSVEALQRFGDRLSHGNAASSTPNTPASRQKQIDQAAQQAAGIVKSNRPNGS